MSEQRTGKVTAEIFEQVILRRLGARDPGVVVGPPTAWTSAWCGWRRAR
jgi:hypothetical protein